MPLFTFEIARRGEAPVIAEVLSLPNFAAAWCNVERLAFKLKRSNGEAYIRVKDSDGHIVALAGIATALASYEKCDRQNCPLKHSSRDFSFSEFIPRRIPTSDGDE